MNEPESRDRARGRAAALDEYAETMHKDNAVRLSANVAAMLLAAFTLGAGLFLVTGDSAWFPVTMVVGLAVSLWWQRYDEIRRDVASLRDASDGTGRGRVTGR